MNGWMERHTDEWTEEWMDGMDGWKGTRMNGRKNGWNGWSAAEKEMEMELILEVSRTGLG